MKPPSRAVPSAARRPAVGVGGISSASTARGPRAKANGSRVSCSRMASRLVGVGRERCQRSRVGRLKRRYRGAPEVSTVRVATGAWPCGYRRTYSRASGGRPPRPPASCPTPPASLRRRWTHFFTEPDAPPEAAARSLCSSGPRPAWPARPARPPSAPSAPARRRPPPGPAPPAPGGAGARRR